MCSSQDAGCSGCATPAHGDNRDAMTTIPWIGRRMTDPLYASRRSRPGIHGFDLAPRRLIGGSGILKRPVSGAVFDLEEVPVLGRGPWNEAACDLKV